MSNKLSNAIDSKKVIQFEYNEKERTVEPYCYGRSKNGEELLQGFQTGSSGESKNRTGWRLFKIKDISELKILDEEFKGDRKGYNPKDPAMKQIFCGVEKENID